MSRNKRRSSHEYTVLEKAFVLGKIANEVPYSKIEKLFLDNFGFPIPKGQISRIKAEGMGETPQKRNDEKPNGNAIVGEKQTETAPSEPEFDTVKIRKYLIVNLIKYIQDKTIDDTERVKRIKDLIAPINKGLDGIDLAKKAIATTTVNVHTGDNISLTNIDLSNVDPDTLRGLLPWFRTAFCEGCPLRKGDVIDVKESE